LFSEH